MRFALLTRRMKLSFAGALLAPCLMFAGCSKRAASGTGSEATATAPVSRPNQPRPGEPGCYRMASAQPCPRDASDPSGKGLPSSGTSCSLGECGVCGSASGPAFRDTTGTAQAGYCICVAKSDDSGSAYSCFTPSEWRYD